MHTASRCIMSSKVARYVNKYPTHSWDGSITDNCHTSAQHDISNLNTLSVKMVVSHIGHLEVDVTFDTTHL